MNKVTRRIGGVCICIVYNVFVMSTFKSPQDQSIHLSIAANCSGCIDWSIVEFAVSIVKIVAMRPVVECVSF